MVCAAATILFTVNGHGVTVDTYTFLISLAIPFSVKAAPYIVVILCLVINWRFGIVSSLFSLRFSINFYIWYGNNKHLKESLVFQTKSLYSKNPFLPSIIRNSYPQYLILHPLVQWYRAQSVQVTVSTLKSIEVLLCLLIKPFLSWYLRPQTVQKKIIWMDY